MLTAKKSALVTGASSGLGRAIALELASQGFRVGLVARRGDRLRELAARIVDSGGTADPLIGDLRDGGFAASVVDTYAARAGRLDVLVNNAGSPTGTLDVASDAELDAAFALNVRAGYRLACSALPHLERSRGNIVNISSAAVARTIAYDLIYLTSKGAMEVMSRGLAKLAAPLGVRVNTVAPGIVETEIMHSAGLSGEAERVEYARARSLQPLPYVGTPEDIARAVAYLASPGAAFITGATLHVDGGMGLGG